MARLTFVVPPEFDGQRVDTFLRSFGGISGSTLKRAKQVKLGITQDGEHIRTIDMVKLGSTVVIDTAEQEQNYSQSDIFVPTSYEDKDILVYNKPPNLPIHPSKGHPTDTLLNVFAKGETTSGLTFRAINRLDKDTSGLVFVAKNAHSASFYPSRIEKHYLAIANGKITPDSGKIDLPIGRENEEGIKRIITPEGQRSVTNYKVIYSTDEFSLVLLKLETGRTHQIRVHLSHIGHPLLGDTLYGGDTNKISRQALHCLSGTLLSHNNKIEDIFAPLPQDFLDVLGQNFNINDYLI